MSLAFRALTDEEVEALDAGLELSARMAKGERPLSLAQVQQLYDEFLRNQTEHSEGIVALGLAFGNCIMQAGVFEWIRVDDEWGSETSIAVIGKEVCGHPISMIQKRLEAHEDVDIQEMADELQARLFELAKNSGDRNLPEASGGEKPL